MSSGKKAYRIKSRSSQFPVYKDREKPAQVRVKDLLSRMADAWAQVIHPVLTQAASSKLFLDP
jgi:hypothetical protein